MISICVPVLRRYDLLRELLLSLQASTVVPDAVHIIDNGMDEARLAAALLGAAPCPCYIERPAAAPLGLAEAWNRFISLAPEERFIVNDDITFAPESLAAMLAEKASFVSCTFGFSCFLLRDECVRRVGLFDETISPGYAYFEDMDYLRRMKVAGVEDAVVQCGVRHLQSATPAAYTAKETQEHHKKFQIAQANYTRKWADGPSWDQLRAIGGNGAHA